MTYCVACGSEHDPGTLVCPDCGEPALMPARQAASDPGWRSAPPAAAPAYMPVVPTPRSAPSQGLAIVGLILNIIIWPGLGSLIGGRSEGWAQGFLFLLAIPLSIILIGIPLLIIAWVWAIVTGVDMINQAVAADRARPAY